MSTDTRIRELERQAALGDHVAGNKLAETLERSLGFRPCLDCGRFFPGHMGHECDPETLSIGVPHQGRRPKISRETIFDSEYVVQGVAQTSFFVNYHGFNSHTPRHKYWGVDTNLQGQNGIYIGHTFHAHRIAVLLPAGCDERRRNWLLNNTFVQLRFSSWEAHTIPGLLCYRDEEEGADDWIVQIAGGPPEDVPFEQRRGNEGLKGVDLTVNGRAGLVLQDLSAFRVLLGTPALAPDWFDPLLIRVALAGFLVRDDP